MSTPTIETTDWHPSWCAKNDNLCGPTDSPIESAHHESRPEIFHRDVGDFGQPNDGEEFTVESVRVFIESPESDPPPRTAAALEITFTSPSYKDCSAHMYMSSQRARDMADWLRTQADRLDTWQNTQP